MLQKMNKPRKINTTYTAWLRKVLISLNIRSGFELYVTDTVCGRCDLENKNITVPVWAVERSRKDTGYAVYYACHEIAHVIAPPTKGDVHGAKFQAAFKSICPKEYWHFELEYKPKSASAAGIKRNDE
jgi:hypothetical protein